MKLYAIEECVKIGLCPIQPFSDFECNLLNKLEPSFEIFFLKFVGILIAIRHLQNFWQTSFGYLEYCPHAANSASFAFNASKSRQASRLRSGVRSK